MFYNRTNNFDEIKKLFPDKTDIEVVITPCRPKSGHRVPGGLILRKLMVCFPIIRFFQFWPNCRRLSAGAMSSLQPGGKKRQTRLQHQGGVQLWNGKPHEDKALGRSCSGGDFNLSLGIAQNFTPFRFSAGFILPRSCGARSERWDISSTNVERLFSYGGLAFLLKNLTRFSSWERMPSWLTLIWDGCE